MAAPTSEVILISASRTILTINAGSSSIKFALFDEQMQPCLQGKIVNIGQVVGQARMQIRAHAADLKNFTGPLSAPDYNSAIAHLQTFLQAHCAHHNVRAIVHRVVHGGPDYWQTTAISPAMLHALRRLSPYDPEHLPQELKLIDALQHQYPDLPHFACFDTAFHHQMPRVARLLPIPYRYFEQGVQRYGFHGISCQFLARELARIAPASETGRVIVAHLGSGVSISALLNGRSIDTSMGFTPASGVPMSCRAGDLDPGLAWYLACSEGMRAAQFHNMVNCESGLLGVSGSSADMRELLLQQMHDVHAADAVEMFCHHSKKAIAAMAASLQGVDTLVFAAGIGEAAPEIRRRICASLGFMGIVLDEEKNTANAAIISSGKVVVRVMHTDEEWMMAKQLSVILSNGDK